MFEWENRINAWTGRSVFVKGQNRRTSHKLAALLCFSSIKVSCRLHGAIFVCGKRAAVCRRQLQASAIVLQPPSHLSQIKNGLYIGVNYRKGALLQSKRRQMSFNCPFTISPGWKPLLKGWLPPNEGVFTPWWRGFYPLVKGFLSPVEGVFIP